MTTTARCYILTCGSSSWTDRERIASLLSRLTSPSYERRPVTLYVGSGEGADAMVREVAASLNPAPTVQDTPERLAVASLDYVLAFHADLSAGGTTRELVARAVAQRVTVYVDDGRDVVPAQRVLRRAA